MPLFKKNHYSCSKCGGVSFKEETTLTIRPDAIARDDDMRNRPYPNTTISEVVYRCVKCNEVIDL